MTQLTDLTDDCLLLMMDRMPPDQLFKMLCLNRRLNQLAAGKIEVKIKAIRLKRSNMRPSFFTCDHFDSISWDQVLVLDKDTRSECLIQDLHDLSKRSVFFSLLAKFASVKSIDFGSKNFKELPGDFLLEVFQRCPQLECVKMNGTLIKKDDWEMVFDQIGHRIVHFAIDNQRLLALVAAKCANMKEVDWQVSHILNGDCMAAIKQLPKSWWIKISCSSLDVDFVFDENQDVIDELRISQFNCLKLGPRLNRLSSLKWIFDSKNVGADSEEGLVRGVNFAGLKKLDLGQCVIYHKKCVNFLLASRFPLLEEFCFTCSGDFTEQEYDILFQRMSSVKKLRLTQWCKTKTINLLRSAVDQLKKLETISFKMLSVPTNDEQDDFLVIIERFVNEIDSLKKLIVKPKFGNDKWQQSFEDGIKRLKREQSRVAIALLNKY